MFKKIIYLLFIICLNSIGQDRNTELAYTLYGLIPLNADNNDVVKEMHYNKLWIPASTITYSIIEDTSKIFGITADTLYVADNTDLEVGTYGVIFQVRDRHYNDYDTIFIECRDTVNSDFFDLDAANDGDDTRDSPDSTITSIDGAGSTVSHTYWLKRGTTETLTAEVDPDDNFLTFAAYGRGVRPLLKSALSGGGQGVILRHDNPTTNIFYYDISFEKSTGLGAVFKEYGTHFLMDNCIIRGYGDKPFNNLRAYWVDTITLRNCVIDSAGTDNVHIGQSGNVIIEGNEFNYSNSDNNNGDCVHCNADSTNTTRYQNFTFRYNLCDHTHYGDKHGFCINCDEDTDTAYTVDVYYNRMLGDCNDTTDHKNISIQTSRDATVHHNWLKDGSINMNAYQGAANFKFYTNICDSSYVTALYLHNAYAAWIVNNTFHDFGIGDGQNHCSAIAGFGRTATVKNNIFDSNGLQDSIFYQGYNFTEDYNLADPNFADFVEGANSIEGDANFVNKAMDDFRLNISSIAIDAGTDVSLTRDFKNYIIPQGDAQDMGAYERIIGDVLKFPGSRDMWLEFPGNRKFVIKK